MKNKLKNCYILLGLVGAFWFTGCCTYPGGMVAVYSSSPRPHAPKVLHHAPAPKPKPRMPHAPAPHYQQAFLPHHFR